MCGEWELGEGCVSYGKGVWGGGGVGEGAGELVGRGGGWGREWWWWGWEGGRGRGCREGGDDEGGDEVGEGGEWEESGGGAGDEGDIGVEPRSECCGWVEVYGCVECGDVADGGCGKGDAGGDEEGEGYV